MHVFYVHSHITFIVSMLYLNNTGLDFDRVRFITSRDYSLKTNHPFLDISDFYQFLERTTRLKKAISLKWRIKRIDKLLTDLTGDQNFTLYIPQFNHSIFQILATHPLCDGTVLMEEGITSYKKDEHLYQKPRMSFMYALSCLYSNRFKMGNGHYNPIPRDKFKFALCVNDSCFPFLNKFQKTVTSLSHLQLPEYKSFLLNNSRIFLLDSFRERTGISMETYLSLVKCTLEYDKGDRTGILIKFHPEQNKETRIKTVEYIEANFDFLEVITLPDNCIMELEFIQCNDLTVLGMHTSLLFYAKTLGHSVYSSIRHTMKIPEVRDYVKHIMDQDQIATYMSYDQESKM